MSYVIAGGVVVLGFIGIAMIWWPKPLSAPTGHAGSVTRTIVVDDLSKVSIETKGYGESTKD